MPMTYDEAVTGLEDLKRRKKVVGRDIADRMATTRPLPWAREAIAIFADAVVDTLASEYADLWDRPEFGETGKDMVCELLAEARLGFIERAVELSFASVGEAGAA